MMAERVSYEYSADCRLLWLLPFGPFFSFECLAARVDDMENALACLLFALFHAKAF